MKILSFLIIIVFASCNSSTTPAKPIKNLSKWEQLMASLDSVTDKSRLDIDPNHFDTSNIRQSPIEFVSIDTGHSNIIFSDVRAYDVITFKFRNIGNKTIEGVRLRWYCNDAFGDPALLVSSHSTQMQIGYGQSDDHVSPGSVGVVKWEGDASKIKVVSAWPYEVAFDDGTVWRISGNNSSNQ